MSSPHLNPSPRQPQAGDWAARLIPGAAGAFRVSKKKAAMRVGGDFQPFAAHIPASSREIPSPENFLAGLLPEFLKKVWARNGLSAMAADFALITVNWLLVVAIFIQFGRVFSHTQAFEHSA